MRKRLVIAAGLLSLMVLIGTGGLETEAPAQTVSVSAGMTVLFPDDPGFGEREQEFTSRTGLRPGAALAAEFDKGVPIGEVRSSTGLVGTIFQDAWSLMTLPLGQPSHIVYGTITVPEGVLLRGRDFAGEYGIVVYGNPVVITLAGRRSGELAAFVVTSVSLFAPPASVFYLLFQLITPPQPPAAPVAVPGASFGFNVSVDCEKLPSQRALDIAVGSGATIIELPGAFAVKEAGLGSLAVSLLGPALLALVTAPNYLYLSAILERGEAKVAAPVGPEFTFLVQASEEKAACVKAAYIRSASGDYRLQGKVYHN
ncbi:MAG: hypothetical protein NUW06_00465 [Candidatus Acetothermia bacterium]|jgi:hypothetical protein|nr:hypothetical protein [Candidatus Acetothermia bacterium]MDH7504987.1 hypothetical protein [Candidatus Acetothermia bacterium]